MEKVEVSAESLLESELEIIADCAKTFIDFMQRFHSKYEGNDEWVKHQCSSNEKVSDYLNEISECVNQLQYQVMEINRDEVLQELKELILSAQVFKDNLLRLYEKYEGGGYAIGELGKTDNEIKEEIDKLRVVMNQLEM
jgi:hypothetical protein